MQIRFENDENQVHMTHKNHKYIKYELKLSNVPTKLEEGTNRVIRRHN